MSKLILDELSKEGQNIRKAYQRRLPSDNSKDYYFMQRNTGDTESVTVEYGFLDSKGDDVNQLKNNWQNYAEAVVRAIIEYLNLIYIPLEEKSYYTVKSGDTLWSIAKKFGISVSELKDANGLTSSVLRLGQVLTIPAKIEQPLNENIYIVKSGDSLYKIARNYDTTVNEIMRLNGLTSTLLSVGQRLNIPSNNTSNTYTVKNGDSLYKISNIYNTTVDELKSLNNLNNNIISIGQVLKLPTTFENTYIVKKGDSLYKIANEYNTTIDKLKQLNNLETNLLNIGQVLKIK